MTTQTRTDPRKHFAPRFLPWLLTVAAFAFYWFTLNRWVSPFNLQAVAKISGWTWQPEIVSPILFLVTQPFRWLPAPQISIALNMFSAACAALTLGLLARSVALLPHDQTDTQRKREHSDFSFLTTGSAWLPPFLAVLVCGLQMTFWQNATNYTGEMFDLLLFAFVIWSLLEYRLDEKESRLFVVAVVYGGQIYTSTDHGATWAAHATSNNWVSLRLNTAETGTATITVTLNNGGKTNNIVRQSFTVTVIPPAPPTLDPIANMTVTENAGVQSIQLTGLSAGPANSMDNLIFSATSDVRALSPKIKYTSPASTALLTFTPPAHFVGTATVTVTVSERNQRAASVRRQFSVTVAPPVVSHTLAQVVSAPANTMTMVQPAVAATLVPRTSANGQFQFQVTGLAGGKYVVQATEDLATWTSIQTNTAPFVVQDETAGVRKRFYRAYNYQP